MTTIPDLDGEIIAGERIDGIKIGDSREMLIRLLPKDVKVETLEHALLYIAKPWKVWVDARTQRITQISVGKGIRGKFLESISVGSTLRQVETVAGNVVDALDVYLLEGYPGICFELADIDDWNDLEAPIEFITVFSPPNFQGLP